MATVTKKIIAVPVDKESIDEYSGIKIKRIVGETCAAFAEQNAQLAAEFTARLDSERIFLNRFGEKEGVYYVKDIVGVIPDLNAHECNAGYSYHVINESFVAPANLKFAGFQGKVPTFTEAKNLFNDRVKYFREDNGYIKICGTSRPGLTYYSDGYRYMWTSNGNKYGTNYYNCSTREYFWVIPIFRFGTKSLSTQKILQLWIDYDLTPKKFKTDATRKIFDALKRIYTKYKDFVKFGDDKIFLDERKILEAVKAGTNFDFLKIDAAENSSTIGGREFEDALREKLLACDNIRVGLDRYDEKLLTDPNRGHWDLWDIPEGAGTVKLSAPIYARNPLSDVNAAGIVAIDFGTKSTVVAFEDESGKIIPLQVGTGDYSKSPCAENYENPTIIEFRHMEKFLADYAARAGRPQTSWEDVTVSHKARKNLQRTSDSNLYASFFDNLKQWCGDLNFTTKIRDHDGNERDLPPFREIADGEFNPLEYYAYHLGAFINHMLNPNHIFLKYIMTFPVMYSTDIRERMLKNFSAGIRKSLPTALLADENAMKNFRVVEGTSEPAAYAVTALEGYGFMDGKRSDIYYAVFDFGGGTTDFDFGVLKIAEGDDADFYDYVLTHFGSHGDRTLGGENLLRLMAFEIFKANRDKLINVDGGKIPFTWAAEKNDFAGSEGFVRSSQEANLNMRNLTEILRPVWEAPDSDAAKKIFDSGEIELTLFDDAGNELTGKKLSVDAQNFFDPPPPDPVIVDETEFKNIFKLANENNPMAMERLGEWAHAGHTESVKALENLATAGYQAARDALIQITTKKIADAARVADEKKLLPQDTPLVDLKKILRNRICRGIDNFFIAMRDAFDKVSGGEDNGVAALKNVTEIKIFLAGNSTKSALVKKIFAEYIDVDAGRARELLDFGASQPMPRFVLYPPLGTDDADEIQIANGIIVDKKNFERPTGKTGVAFGLLRCREGSGVRVVDITPEGRNQKQVPFQFYVGRARFGKFSVVIDKAVKIGTWHKFIGAKLGVFDLLYTTESIAATNTAPVSVAKRVTIEIDADPAAAVYVKAVDANKICYVVSKDAPAENIDGTELTLD